MRREPVWNAALALRVHARQGREESRHTRGIEADAGPVLDAEPIRLELVVAAVLEEEDAQSGGTKIGEGARARHEDAEDGQPEAGLRLTGVLLRRMTRGDMPDFVAEHTGQLRLVLQIWKDAPGDVDEPARQRKRVDCRRVDDGKRPFQVRPMRLLGQALTDLLHVALQLRIVILPHLAANLDVLLLTDGELFCLAHHRDLLLACPRIGGAPPREHEGNLGGSGTGSYGGHARRLCNRYATSTHQDLAGKLLRE